MYAEESRRDPDRSPIACAVKISYIRGCAAFQLRLGGCASCAALIDLIPGLQLSNAIVQPCTAQLKQSNNFRPSNPKGGQPIQRARKLQRLLDELG